MGKAAASELIKQMRQSPSGQLGASARHGLAPAASTAHDGWPSMSWHTAASQLSLETAEAQGRQMRPRETQPAAGPLHLHLHVCFLFQVLCLGVCVALGLIPDVFCLRPSSFSKNTEHGHFGAHFG